MSSRSPRIEIEYCPACRWLLRAGWMAQEILMTFEAEAGEVALQPSPVAGTFEIRVDGATIFSRKEAGHFPEAKEIKQLIRDKIAPGRDLGHADRKPAS